MLDRDELTTLTMSGEEPCVSIFMPTASTETDNRRDKIALKTQLQKAEGLLAERGLKEQESGRLLAEPKGLLANSLFWEGSSGGLALFAAPGLFRYYRVPLELPEMVTAGDQFHLKPLLPLLGENSHFFLLALSRKSVRLFQCTKSDIRELELEGVPGNIDEALQYDETDRRPQHSVGKKSGGGGAFHGHGAGPEATAKEDARKFFRIVDRGIWEVLREEKAPLVLASVEQDFRFFREVTSYAGILDTFVKGNPDDRKPGELLESAWEIVAPVLQERRSRDAARYRQLLGTGKSSGNIREVLPAALQGRVESIFVSLDEHIWGRADPMSGEVVLHEGPSVHSRDLLDAVAVQTLLTGGTVYAVPEERMPEDAADGLAAVFRY